MSPWREYGPSRPRPVEGGIKAKSQRGAIGEQWWSKRFLAVLESYGMSSRLQRGRSYARKGQVLEFTLATGTVTARVQGSRRTPYRVSLAVKPLTAAKWQSVESLLASQALFRARLLAGEMPAEIESVFPTAGRRCSRRPRATWRWTATARTGKCRASTWRRSATYWPRRSTPTRSRCWPGGARDARNSWPRCAARGRTPPGPSGGPVGGPDGVSPAMALLSDVAAPPLAQSLADFWTPGLSQARLRALPPSPPTPADLLLRLADPPDVQVCGVSLRDLLAPAYARLADPEANEASEK